MAVIVEGGNFAYTRGVAYPIVVDQDTTFVGANFMQERPHTEGVFDVRPGVVLTLTDCNLVNVTVPDGAVIDGGNGIHGEPTETGDKDRPTVFLLCECEKCACYRKVLVLSINSRAKIGFDGRRWQHHELKPIAAARRAIPELRDADVLWQMTSNGDRLVPFVKA